MCFGDSLTNGRMGKPYDKYIKGFKIEKDGFDGRATTNMLEVVKEYLTAGKSADMYVLAIGSNDMIGPFYMTTGTQVWKDYYEKNQKQVFLPNVEDFKKCYTEIVEALVATKKPVILVCPPHIQLEKFEESQEVAFNKAIKEIADKYKLQYVDMLKLEKDYFGQTAYYKTVRTYDSFPRATVLGILAMIPLFDSIVPALSGRKLTVDGIHSSTKTAKLEGEAIKKIAETL